MSSTLWLRHRCTRRARSRRSRAFASSPDLKAELVRAIIDALDAHTTMSSQALASEQVQRGLRDVLFDHAGLYESLRHESLRRMPAVVP